MLVILSPAKTQDFKTKAPSELHTNILCKNETVALVDIMREYSATKLKTLMGISSNLAKLNYERYQAYDENYYTDKNSKQALYAFQGDVYVGLQADSFDTDDVKFAQDHLAILSGLYGILRPLDYIQPHRLEMGTKLKTPSGKNLYEFWHDKLLKALDTVLSSSGSRVLINLASNEYFKAIDTKKLNAEIIDIDFKEKKGGKYATVGILAKRARGLMANYIVKKRITTPMALKKFTVDGYKLNKELSEPSKMVFTR